MKNTIFCVLITTCLLAGSAIPGSAQNKRWEHNLYEGVGMAKKFDSHDNQTVAFHVGYGINYYLSSKWSVMPGVAIRAKALGHNSGYTGSCASTYIDVPLLAQYHFGGEKRQGIVLELGPVVSFLAHNERYSGTEWCPQHPYWGMKEYKNIDVGVRPAVYYETGHWRFGLQSHIGMLDIKNKNDRLLGSYISDLDDPYRAFDVVATINFHW